MKLPQLTLRELFWLVLVAALACGWWVQYRDTQRQLQTEISEREAVTEALLLRLMSHGGYSVEHDKWGRRVLHFHGREDLGPIK